MSGLILTLESMDERLLNGLVARRRRVADVLMRAITRLGEPGVIVTLTLALASGLIPDARSAGMLAAFALTLSHLAVQVLKRSVTRPRPQLPVGIASLVVPQDRFSFPSGHAAAALSVALPLALALPDVAGTAVLLVGLLVGVSRCYLGVHYPGDVLAGWVLGALCVGAGLATHLLV
jgi:undecaprenyl-diphosphatase